MMIISREAVEHIINCIRELELGKIKNNHLIKLNAIADSLENEIQTDDISLIKPDEQYTVTEFGKFKSMFAILTEGIYRKESDNRSGFDWEEFWKTAIKASELSRE